MEPAITSALVFSLIGLIGTVAYVLKRIKKFDSFCCKIKCSTPQALTRENTIELPEMKQTDV